ncbi:hypothetical protein DFH08DRAFT_953932 [Mycena albidolilacea]|uniref:Uncharacterized protein n=1 Tax=Mycena albidolilacea TaxID=1033008 RepID=A0AAD7EWV2_9AGAR|nr:hypothetical protein DFH08DRAFT_953932 [Mycena albidolilacea]
MSMNIERHRTHFTSAPRVLDAVLDVVDEQHRAVYKDWYTAPSLPRFWSCDWAIWKATELWLPSRGGVEYNLTGPFPLPAAPIPPIAFFDADGYGCGDLDDFAFVCEGRYYLYEHAPYRVRWYYATYAEPRGVFACTARYHELFARARELREIRESIGAGVRQMTEEAQAELLIVRQQRRLEGRVPPLNDRYTLLFGDPELCGEWS